MKMIRAMDATIRFYLNVVGCKAVTWADQTATVVGFYLNVVGCKDS